MPPPEPRPLITDHQLNGLSENTRKVISGALLVLVAMSWNDAVKLLVKKMFGETDSFTVAVLYAVGVTTAVTCTLLIATAEKN